MIHIPQYSLFVPHQIVFGWGRRRELGTLAAGLGRRALLVMGSRSLEKTGLADELMALLHAAGLDVVRFAAPSREPEVADVDRLVGEFRSCGAGSQDVVVAVGGGSTIDLAKATSALVTNGSGESVVDYLEGVGCGRKIVNQPLPLIALPTTSGTGSEATKNAVISSNSTIQGSGVAVPATPYKKSLRADAMIPRIALVDPELSVSLPATTTAYTGMDAITQLIESHLSRRAAPVPSALALHGLKQAIPALPVAVKDETSQMAREALSHAALLSGIALANSGLGFAHGVAAALGVTCGVPHGLACAVMLPAALKINRTIRADRLAELESLFDPACLSEDSAASRFIERIERLCLEVGIPSRLSDIGVTRDQLPLLVPGSRGNSMSGNPRDVSDEELLQTLTEMW